MKDSTKAILEKDEEVSYNAHYCTNCGSLCKKIGTQWKCPKHGTRRGDGVTTN